jgi:hypothetical protein
MVRRRRTRPRGRRSRRWPPAARRLSPGLVSRVGSV